MPRLVPPRLSEATPAINLLCNPGFWLVEPDRVGLSTERLIGKVPDIELAGRGSDRAELDQHAPGVH